MKRKLKLHWVQQNDHCSITCLKSLTYAIKRIKPCESTLSINFNLTGLARFNNIEVQFLSLDTSCSRMQWFMQEPRLWCQEQRTFEKRFLHQDSRKPCWDLEMFLWDMHLLKTTQKGANRMFLHFNIGTLETTIPWTSKNQVPTLIKTSYPK